MKVTKPETSHKDSRGTITDILCNQHIDYVTFIDIKKDAIRGNHYHKETTQYIYILHGTILYRTRLASGEIIDSTLSQGELMFTDINEAHAMQALTDATFMVFTKGPRGGDNYETDTFRLDSPILTL